MVGRPRSSRSSRSSARTPARVWVSRADSGSSRRRTGGGRGPARGRARPAGARLRRALSDARSRELGDAKALEQRIDVRAISCTEAHVVNDVEVWEQRVFLEEVADPSSLGCDIDAGDRCREELSRRGSPGRAAAGRARRPREAPSSSRPPTGLQSKGLPLLDRQVCACLEGPKRMGELEPERHLVVSLTESRTTALIVMRSALIASATVKFDVELLVDRERERLRNALGASLRT